jgi:Lon-like ATP-dependent protease
MDDTVEDTPEMRRAYARFVAREVARDGRLPEFTRGAMEDVVLEARRRAGRKGHLTLALRNLGGLVRAAGDVASGADAPVTTRAHVLAANAGRAPSSSRSRTTTSSVAGSTTSRSRRATGSGA